jgi:uncharacterized protein (DUF433 family)
MEIAPGIIVDTGIKGGKPIIQGTRVPVTLVLDKLAVETPFEEIMKEYDLTKEQILDVLKYAAMVISNEEVKAVQPIRRFS